jgi:glycerol-3-phosphate dehydrogenase
MKGEWTATEALPGGNVGHFNGYRDEMQKRYASLGRDLVEALVRRHGTRAKDILGDAKGIGDLGRHFGAGLTEREVEYLRREEWAETAEDVLRRRTKAYLHLTDAEQRAVAEFVGR